MLILIEQYKTIKFGGVSPFFKAWKWQKSETKMTASIL